MSPDTPSPQASEPGSNEPSHRPETSDPQASAQSETPEQSVAPAATPQAEVSSQTHEPAGGAPTGDPAPNAAEANQEGNTPTPAPESREQTADVGVTPLPGPAMDSMPQSEPAAGTMGGAATSGTAKSQGQPAPEGSSEKPRVTVNPTGAETAKAVPSIAGDDTPVPGLEGAAPRPSPAPPRPLSSHDVEVPRGAQLDPEVEAELAAAMSQNALSEELNRKTEGEAAESIPLDLESLEPGKRLKGTIQTVGEEDVFVDLGMRGPAIVSKRQFNAEKPPEVGQKVDVIVDSVNVAEGTVAASLPRGKRKPAGNWDAIQQGQIVDALVTKTNKGGLEVTVSNLRGFLPASQVDLGFVENLESFVGQKLTCMVTEVNPAKRNLILSRRALLLAERQEKEKELWTELSTGQQLSGTVKTIKDYGVFVDLGGVDGFLHVGEMSWNRITHPNDLVKVGETIEVKILKLEPESKKIALGMKQLQSNPWQHAEQKYPIGSTVSGRVTRTTEFGAFVEIERGVEGLIHISELEHRRVGRVNEVVNEGDTIDAKVLTVEPNRKRISLSLKALKTKPEAPQAPAPEPYERKNKGPLRGGREPQEKAAGNAGGLFGNPDDFQR